MVRMKPFLCPIDYSEFSIRGYDYAQSLAAHYHAGLILQHVLYALPPFYSDRAYEETCRKERAEALQKLKRFARRWTRTGIQPECVVQEGIATQQILKLARTRDVSLIVMGSHGWQGLDRLMLGSVTERVLRKAHCPVLAVRKPVHDFVAPGRQGDPVELKRILLCVDFSRRALRRLNFALSIAREYHAELTVLHVLEHHRDYRGTGSAGARARKRLREMLPPEASRDVALKFVVRVGALYPEILDLAAEERFDLVMMGVRRHLSFDDALYGPGAYRVMRPGPCPVLAFRV